MNLELSGKNAIITGGSAGIGLACAKALLAEGANVIIIGRNEERLENAVSFLKKIANNHSILAISADLTDAGASQRIVKRLKINLAISIF